MTYNPNIPQSTDNISSSQADILTNFQQLEAIFGTNAGADHFAWDYATASSRGLHQQVSLPTPRGSDPSLTGTAGMLYSKSVAGVAQAFFANATAPVQITGLVSKASPGYAFIAGGIVLKWANVSFSAGSGTITFPTGGSIPVFSAIYIVLLQNTGNNLTNEFAYVSSISTTNFTYYSTQRTVQTPQAGGGYYLAIGAA
jgi:hypothetical protein